MSPHSSSLGSHRTAGARDFIDTLMQGIEAGWLEPQLTRFDLPRLARAVAQCTTHPFGSIDNRSFRAFPEETSPGLLMRVAMGLARHESHPDEQALTFFTLMSNGEFLPAAQVLRHVGTSSAPTLEGIMTLATPGACNYTSKWCSGDTLDWSSLAADTWPPSFAGCCIGLNVWHADLETFLTGIVSDPTVTTMLWLPDLFMKRLAEDGNWTLLPPHQCPELNGLYGAAFEARYLAHEQRVAQEPGLPHECVRARTLWQRLLQLLSHNSGPGLMFRDTCNLASLQRHAGMIHGPSADGALLLNSDADTVATAVRGIINLERHLDGSHVDHKRLQHTARLAVRMLDNAIELLAPDARSGHTLCHYRSQGIAPGGVTAALDGIDAAPSDRYSSLETLISHFAHAIMRASHQLACERGPCPAFHGSLWQQGALPQDAARMIRHERGDQWCDLPAAEETLATEALRHDISRDGIRNLALMANGLAPDLTQLPIPLEGEELSLEETARLQSEFDQAWAIMPPLIERSAEALDYYIYKAWRLGLRSLTLK
ncbi:ribonucleotide reductase N-terminal alpha domain-containing protein [Kushneria phosphatilytica]|nr:ribonucleotide reductase N-terminal alpha domain-containing protein [Kushneria phosphatilytica]OHV07718.1 hypothetical protein BH688_16160 [Kushneria phosphatilytica]